MTKQQFKIWMLTHGYTQETLAVAMGITTNTISTYNRNGRYPTMFLLALKGLEGMVK